MLYRRPAATLAMAAGLGLLACAHSRAAPCAAADDALVAALRAGVQPAGPNADARNDGIIHDIGPDGKSASGYGHPRCKGKEAGIAATLQGGK